MRDALGGSVSIVIIVVFIVISLGYLAFNVNYTKAYRMKDKVISLYNENDGYCDTACREIIAKYATSIGYSTDNSIKCPDYYERVGGLYCIKAIDVYGGNEHVVGDQKRKIYYRVVTKINLQIPVISNVFDFKLFYISGDTKDFVRN